MLDRLRPLSYIAACILVAGCVRKPGPLVPAALAPADRDSAVAWARATLPPRQTAIRFRWRFQDQQVSYAGRGLTRIGPPDSLRFDYAGPLGLGAGAAVVLGDSVAWAEPAANFRSLVPAIPMLWAALGMVRPPAAEAMVYGRVDGTRRLWRFVQGADTLAYLATAGTPWTLEAEWRRGGSVVARSRTEFDAHAMPASARIDFPEGPARFELTVVAVDTLAVIAPALWRGRR